MGNPYAPPGENARPTSAPPASQQPHPDRSSPANPASGRPADDTGSDRWPGALRPEPVPTPQRPPVPPEVTRATARRSLHFFALLLAAVVTSSFPLPWQAAALVFVLIAIVVGVRTLVLAWRSGVRGGVLFALGGGIAMAGMVALAMTTLLLLWPQQMERQRCLAAAVTISATQRCEAQFQESIQDLAPQRRTPTS